MWTVIFCYAIIKINQNYLFTKEGAMYHTVFFIGNIVFFIMLGVSILLLLQKIIYHIFGLFPSKRFPDAKKNYKYAILIPARNESAVIEELLNSIKNQTYDKDLLKTYVIVESLDDPTCEICKNYENTEVFVRQHLENKGKGYALDEAVKHIFSKKEKYDAFFIFDADNVLDKNFITEMNKCYDAGYKLCLGYRNSKNWNGGWVASCSALTFSMINTFQNKSKARFNRNVVVSGTGFYISADILESLGGWDFCTLTEDYEISTYSTINNIKSTYNEYAEFYDEQPTKLKTSWNQRLRWCKGYSQVNKRYQKKLFKSILFDKKNRLNKLEYGLSILPVVCLLVTTILYALFTLTLAIIGSCIRAPQAIDVWIAFIIVIASMYLFFVLYSMVMLLAERKHTNITLKNSLVCCLMSPIYWACYLPIYLTAMLKKEVEWKPIAHNVIMSQDGNSKIEVTLDEGVQNEDKEN